MAVEEEEEEEEEELVIVGVAVFMMGFVADFA
jgi:hypothetical protein